MIASASGFWTVRQVDTGYILGVVAQRVVAPKAKAKASAKGKVEAKAKGNARAAPLARADDGGDALGELGLLDYSTGGEGGGAVAAAGVDQGGENEVEEAVL